MKKIIIIILIVIMCNLANGWEVQYVQIENETLSVQPIINICENTTSVFKIQRENYSNNSTALEIKFIQKTINEDIKSTNISKTINKYTSSNTGDYHVSKNGNASIIFEILNQSTRWDFIINCFNESVNETITNNTIINNSINESINIDINTSMNFTNNTISNNTKELENYSFENNTQQEIICPQEFVIKTNKNIFEPGEKVEIEFGLNYWIQNYEITYHIEHLDGTTVKNKYTTTNNKTKTYTLKQSDQKEQTHKIIAKIESECGSLNAEKIIVVENSIEEEEIEKTNISLEAKIQDNELEVIIEASRGDSSKSVITVFFKNEKGKKIRDEIKFYLESKGSETKIILKEEVENEKIINIIIDGLGITKEVKIENDAFKELVIKEEQIEEKINKTEEIKTETITVKKVELEEIEVKTDIEKTRTKTESVKQENTKKSTNILFAIALGIIFSAGTTIYFRKHSIEKNTKKSR